MAETENKMVEFINMIRRYDSNIHSLNTVLPILVELASLVSTFQHEDIRARQALNQHLKLADLPNGGYLRTDVSNKAMHSGSSPSKKSNLNLQSRENSAESATRSNKVLDMYKPLSIQ